MADLGFLPLQLGAPSHTGWDPATFWDSGVISRPPALSLPCKPLLSRRLMWFCAAVISDQRSSLCLPALRQKVSFPMEASFLGEKIKTGGRG